MHRMGVRGYGDAVWCAAAAREARFHPHVLRRTLACEWVDRGGNLAALQRLLGHSSITVTQRYCRISDSMVRAEMTRLASGASAVASGEEPTQESVAWL